MRLSFLIGMAMTFIMSSSAMAQPLGYYKGYHDAVTNTHRGPTYPYSWGPYSNYGYNPYVGNAGYNYRYRQQSTYYPTPIYGNSYSPYGDYYYQPGFFLQFGRVR